MFLCRKIFFILLFNLTYSMSSFAYSDPYQSLYAFKGNIKDEGSYQLFTIDNKVYGTTYGDGEFGTGSLFSISMDNHSELNQIYSFKDVGFPDSKLVISKDKKYIYGYGLINKKTVLYQLTLKKPYFLTVLHVFNQNLSFWKASRSSLVLSPDEHYLYGTNPTPFDGTKNQGLLFRVTLNQPSYSYEVLYNFTGREDGSQPNNLIISPDGKFLYGTTDLKGPNDCGTIFRYPLIETSPQTIQPVASFKYCDYVNQYNRQSPEPNSLIISQDGHYLYGNARHGQGELGIDREKSGYVFQVNLAKANPTIEILHHFDHNYSSTYPTAFPNSLVLSHDGCHLFGTTYGNISYSLAGTIFSITLDHLICKKDIQSNNFNVLYFFNSEFDKNGKEPQGLVLSANEQFLYGTTNSGGAFARGVLFRYQLK